jgi:hypothetical protein
LYRLLEVLLLIFNCLVHAPPALLSLLLSLSFT